MAGKPPFLGAGASKLIGAAVDRVYDRAKARLLGPLAAGKELRIQFLPGVSLAGLFEAGSRAEGARPDEDTLGGLLRVAGGYLDASRERSKARVLHAVQAFLSEAHQRGDEPQASVVLGGELAKLWGTVTSDVRRIVESEATKVRNVSVLDGIVRANAALGVEDPVVFFVVVRDQALCDECRAVHLLPDGVTPRVFRLSEVSHGYHKKGDDRPSTTGLHPNCRCTLTTLLSGFGFRGGLVTFIAAGHDEYAAQRAR